MQDPTSKSCIASFFRSHFPRAMSMPDEASGTPEADAVSLFNVRLRDYQERLYLKCCLKNTIICLPTGSGKTMIAIRVMIAKLPETVGQYPKQARRTFFLAPQRALVIQQYQAIKQLVSAKIVLITGDDDPDRFNQQDWAERLAKYQVFVVTPDILSEILQKGYIGINNLNLLIFDEMHWAFRDGIKPSGHPYSRIMSIFKEQMSNVPAGQQPRIIAMSATLFSHNPKAVGGIDQVLSAIEQLYQAKIEGGGFSYADQFQEHIVPYREDRLVQPVPVRIDFERLLKIFTKCKTVSYLNQFRLAFQKIQELLETEMGPWFALQFSAICCDSLKRNVLYSINETMLKVFIYITRCIKRALQGTAAPIGTTNRGLWLCTALISDKLRVLLHLLKTTLRPLMDNDSFTCILFVDERVDGNLIYRWLKVLSRHDPELSFLKPAFFCGTFRKDFIEFDQDHKKNYLEDIKIKKRNLIVATAVLEEGIDIPICNVVIRYDGVPNYRAYCQSRGRARDAQSRYYLMVPAKALQKMKNKLNIFHQIDAILCQVKSPDFIQTFEKPQDDDNDSGGDDDDYEDKLFRSIKPYRIGESVLYPSASLALFNRYLMKLPRDSFTEQRMPLVEFGKRSLLQTHHAFVLVFPINSNHIGTVVKGAYFRRRKYASASCVFRACIHLIEHGDIDEHLNVYRPEFILSKHLKELNIRKEVNRIPHLKPADEYVTHVYKNRRSNFLRSLKDDDPDQTYFLYSIVFRGRFPSKNAELAQQQYKPLFLAGSDEDIPPETTGILLAKPYTLERIESYIYFNLFPVKFQLQYCGKLELNSDRMAKAERFHQHVMSTIFWKMFKDQESAITFDSGALIVPLIRSIHGFVVDFGKIDEIQRWLEMRQECFEKKNSSPENLSLDRLRHYDPTTEWISHDNRFTLFSLVHHRDLKLYYIKNFTEIRCNQLMRQPNDDHPNGLTFEQYFREKYELELADRQTPMINAAGVERFQNNYSLFRVKRTVLAANTTEKSLNTLFPLELMTVYPLSSAMYLQICSLPMVFYRLEQHCLGAEFLAMVSARCSLNPVRQNFDVDEILLKSRKSTRETVFDEETEQEILVKPSKLIGLERILEAHQHNEYAIQESGAQQSFETFLEETFLDFDHLDIEEEKLLQPDFEDKFFQKVWDVIQQYLSSSQGEKKQHYWPNQIEQRLEFGDVSMYKFVGDIDEFIKKDGMIFNTFERLDSPHPWQIIQGLTLSKANDSWNIERLETIGDSFLKFTSSLYLFFRYPSYEEKRFVILKDCLVNNRNLFQIALEQNIPEFIFSSLERNIPLNFFKNLMVRGDCPPAVNEQRPGLRYKDVADVVESLIGAFLVYGGAGSAIRFLNDFLDLKAFDPNGIEPKIFFEELFTNKMNPQLNVIGGEPTIFGTELKFVDDQIIGKHMLDRFGSENMKREVQTIYLFHGLSMLEEEIDYCFNNKFLLVQALTHPSMSRSVNPASGEYIYNFIPSYQRLEFIGDACLEFLITYHIYLRDSSLNPTEITVLRSALVNNGFYASIAVKYNLHRFIRHNSFELQKKIVKFTSRFAYKYMAQVEAMVIEQEDQFGATDLNQADVPKTVADILEALFGAIFLDCHFDLDQTWRVFYRMIKMEIDHFMDHVPLMPVYRLYLQHTDQYHWSPVEEIQTQMPVADNHVENDLNLKYRNQFTVPSSSGICKRITLTVDGYEGKTWIGYGRNKYKCKVAAAKKFFAWLENLKKSSTMSSSHEDM